MTTNELRILFDTKFGLSAWPKTFDVDAETYGNVCHTVFTSKMSEGYPSNNVNIKVGPHNGILFKNVELILRNNK